MSDVMTAEVRAIMARFDAGEILTEDEIAKLPAEIEIEVSATPVPAAPAAPAAVWDAAKVAEKNNQNMKSASEDDVLTVMFGDECLLIGEQDTGTMEAFWAIPHADGIATGTATVTPPKGAFNPGSITFNGVDSKSQEITAAVAGFSKRKVAFE
jgi:hypothetical protein